MHLLKIVLLDNALKKHFVSKYNLLNVDANGSGVYEYDWSPDDIEMAQAWDIWKASPKKKAPYEVKAWEETFTAAGVAVPGVSDKEEKAGNSTFLKVAIGVGLGVAGAWMFSSKDPEDEAKKEVKPEDVKRAVSLSDTPRRITTTSTAYFSDDGND